MTHRASLPPLIVTLEAHQPPEGPAGSRPRRGGPMEFHQPRPDDPDRLLATCPGCRSRFVVDREAGRMLALPR